jgi:hypothetical protein
VKPAAGGKRSCSGVGTAEKGALVAIFYEPLFCKNQLYHVVNGAFVDFMQHSG